jgi:hypothetical protein
MSQRDGFGSGFLLGTIIGGVVGGMLGALVVTRREDMELQDQQDDKGTNNSIENKGPSRPRRQVKPSEAETMETARRSLEDKIAMLNASIDEVRQQLGNVNGNSSQTHGSSPITRDS